MFVRYDPVFCHLTGSETGGPELGPVLARDGVLFFEVPSLPGPLDTLAYDAKNNALVWRQKLPEDCLIASYQTDAIDAAVPDIPELPDDAEVIPPIGTPLASGETMVEIRAPYCYFHRFTIRRWTTADETARLIAWAANRRWEMMQIGALWRGHRVATDDVAQSRMTAAVLAGQILPGWSTKWQFLDGSSATVGAAEMIQIALAAQAYVNDLFTRFDAIKSEIQAGEITIETEIEARFSSNLQPAASAA